MNMENKNLFLVVALSLLILGGFHYFYERPRAEAMIQEQQQKQSMMQQTAGNGIAPSATAPAAPIEKAVAEVIANDKRIPIETPSLKGSITVRGGRIDDLTLVKYHTEIDPSSLEIVLLAPNNTANPYYAEFGWVSSAVDIDLPGSDTVWHVEGEKLTPNTPIILSWKSASGLLFERIISVDENYMFTIHQKVHNLSQSTIDLNSYALISRGGTPPVSEFFISYEGPIGYLNSKLNQHNYKDLIEKKKIEVSSQGGWLGITDKYWLTALIPSQADAITVNFRGSAVKEANHYQTDYRGPVVSLAPKGTTETTTHFFAGAKSVELLDAYEKALNIPSFDLAVDFGWFYFITKPIFYALSFFHNLLGNFGLGILLLTILMRALFFPLANKSFRSMSRMRQLQPEMLKIKERYGDDKMRMNQEMMEFYKKNKVNPVAGCLPMLIQIPVFFALYKVLFVTLEMRHAPFYGWIHDLSAPDPTTLFNLFGLIPWTPPGFLMIGVLPVLMGVTMLLQQKLNPQPMDPMQAKVFLIMPFFFTYLLAQFPAGLVLYWTWSNVLAIGQQWYIMRLGAKGKVLEQQKYKASWWEIFTKG